MEYIQAETQKLLDQKYKTTLTIVIAILISVVIFMIVARLITPGESAPGSEKWGGTIYSTVIVLGVAVVVLRRIFMSRMLLSQAAAGGARPLLQQLLITSVIGAAIAESVSVIGLVSYIMTADYQYSWRLGVVSILLILYSFPRRGEWVRAVIAHTGVKEIQSITETGK